MKSWILITTVMFSTPEKDFSGVVIQKFEHKVQCQTKLSQLQDTTIDFGVMNIDVTHKCERHDTRNE